MAKETKFKLINLQFSLDLNIIRESNLMQLKNIIIYLFFRFSSEKCSYSTDEEMEKESV